jgi:CBS domain-containing protein
MTWGPVCLDVEASLSDAARVMAKKNIDAVLVLEEGRLCGLVTDRDIATRGRARGCDPTATSLGEICSGELLTLRAGGAIEDAIARMREHAVRHMPVLDHGSPIGIVSLADFGEDGDHGSLPSTPTPADDGSDKEHETGLSVP